jgi:2,4-dienoyl-CoA reductase-like NADH-dependent reductase (Old Yellow Enzyme family)
MTTDPFQAFAMRSITLRNRIIRSATHEGMADERGFPTPKLHKKYLQLAAGGVGAIITGYAGVSLEGKSPLHRMLMIDRDECIPAYRELVNAVHAEGTPIILQIAHCGRQTRSKVTGFRPEAPSAIRDKTYNEDMPMELSGEKIDFIIDAFVKAALRARDAGFDGVQLHAAHGYLLSEFLSPAMNRRTDEWGGTTENRCKIIAEILRRIREQASDYPVWVKINGYDQSKSGMRIEEAATIAALLEKSGCSAIEVSSGVVEEGFSTARPELNPIDAVVHFNFRMKDVPAVLKPVIKLAMKRQFAPKLPTRMYNLDAAEAVKAAVSIPVIAVGGIKSLADIRYILDKGRVDLAALSRPLIMEPGLVEKFRTKKQTESKCISCDYCLLGIEEEPLKCYHGKLKTEVEP